MQVKLCSKKANCELEAISRLGHIGPSDLSSALLGLPLALQGLLMRHRDHILHVQMPRDLNLRRVLCAFL